MPGVYFIKKQIYIAINIIILIMFLPICLADSQRAQAASASVTVTAKSNSVVKGDAVYVIITVDSSDEIGGFKGYFSYDNSVLRYVTGGSVASGNDDEFLVSDTDRETGTHKIKYVVKFIARAAGSTSIELKSPYAVYSYGDSPSEMSISHIPLNIVVKKKPETQAAGPEATQEPVMTAEPEATQEPERTTPPERTAEPAQTKKPSVSGNWTGGLKASVKNGQVVLSTKEKYTVTELPDDVPVPDGFGKTAMKLGDKVITVYALESSTEHTFVLIYCKKGNADPEFYLYDKEELSIMPYAKVQSWYRSSSGNSVVMEDTDSSMEVQKFKYILAITIIICLLLVIIIISVYMHFKGMNKDELTEILK
ncbi:MAG TPA: hypothetical protein DCZ23_08170 [Lachnospiraceae bacterium]|nr:hypothetical protein [Lachnospiraceae bacterium]